MVLLGVSLWRIYLVTGSVSELAVVSLICCLLPRGFHKAVSWVLFSLFCMLTTFRQSLFTLLFCFLLMTVNAVEKYSLLRIPSYCRVICVGCVNGVTPLVSFLTVARVVSLAITLPGSDPITFDYSIDDQLIDHQSVCKDL